MSSSDLWTWCLEAWGRGEIVSPDVPESALGQKQFATLGSQRLAAFPSLSCSDSLAHLTEEADVEAKSPRIPGASIHIVADEQGNLQKAGEILALSQLLTRGRHRNDLWLDILHLLAELQPEEDGIEARPQAGHSAHLGGRRAVPLQPTQTEK